MTQIIPEDITLNVGIQFHIRYWRPSGPVENWKQPFLLLHGLSSNARTWDPLAARLAKAGYPAAAMDQRGHGLSEKPDSGYDFKTITQDLKGVIDHLGWRQPILVGQSWGGNVLLEFAARFPGRAYNYIFVDGGFLDLKARGPWEQSEIELRPPDLIGIPRAQIADRIRQMHPGWGKDGVEATLGNFEILPDQTVRPWLSLERHMRLLRTMYDQDPASLYPRVEEPVLICGADDGSEKMTFKQDQVRAALAALKKAEVVWFPDAAHDIHLDQPQALFSAILSFQENANRMSN